MKLYTYDEIIKRAENEPCGSSKLNAYDCAQYGILVWAYKNGYILSVHKDWDAVYHSIECKDDLIDDLEKDLEKEEIFIRCDAYGHVFICRRFW